MQTTFEQYPSVGLPGLPFDASDKYDVAGSSKVAQKKKVVATATTTGNDLVVTINYVDGSSKTFTEAYDTSATVTLAALVLQMEGDAEFTKQLSVSAAGAVMTIEALRVGYDFGYVLTEFGAPTVTPASEGGNVPFGVFLQRKASGVVAPFTNVAQIPNGVALRDIGQIKENVSGDEYEAGKTVSCRMTGTIWMKKSSVAIAAGEKLYVDIAGALGYATNVSTSNFDFNATAIWEAGAGEELVAVRINRA